MTETPPSTRTKVISWIDELVPPTRRPDSGATPLDLDQIERALEIPSMMPLLVLPPDRVLLQPRFVLLALLCGALIPSGGCGGDTSDGSGSAAAGGSGTSGKGGSAGSSTGGSGGSGGVATGGSSGVSGSGGVPESYFACADTSECIVRESGCCELCGPNSASGAIAFNRTHRDQVSAILCKYYPEPCPVADCALRPSWVLPFCIEGRCQVIDIREDLLTSCGTDEQCRMRWGTLCCEACFESSELLVALNSQVDYDATVCGSERSCTPCPIPSYPADARAACNADHHCELIRR